MLTRKWLIVFGLWSALWLGMGAAASADMRITFQGEEGFYEMFMKQGRIMSPMDYEGSRMIVDCQLQEVIFVGSVNDRKYWQGTPAELAEAVDSALNELLTPFTEVPGIGDFLGGLFGAVSNQSEAIDVRIREVGRENINGYDTVHHRIEVNSGQGWRTYEELWVSKALMDAIKAEVGNCITLALDLERQLASLIPVGVEEHRAVVEEPAYRSILEQGFPVRSHLKMQVFGVAMDEVTQVIDVSEVEVSDEYFVVPEGYTRVSHAIELLEF